MRPARWPERQVEVVGAGQDPCFPAPEQLVRAARRAGCDRAGHGVDRLADPPGLVDGGEGVAVWACLDEHDGVDDVGEDRQGQQEPLPGGCPGFGVHADREPVGHDPLLQGCVALRVGHFEVLGGDPEDPASGG
jgi:hypothetical protein